MSLSREELRAKLSMIEPDEGMYAGITPADLPEIQALLSDPEEWMAARAIFALSRLGTPEIAALAKAATDERSPVRIAVAAAVAQRPITLPDDAVMQLLRDSDAGVRKFATHAVKNENGPEPRAILNRLATDDATPAVRESATEALRKFQ
jgi:HEAT repeat protein